MRFIIYVELNNIMFVSKFGKYKNVKFVMFKNEVYIVYLVTCSMYT